MTLATRTPPSSPFNTSGPSLILPKMGRIKTERQQLLDATRVNPERSDCASWQGMDKKAEI